MMPTRIPPIISQADDGQTQIISGPGEPVEDVGFDFGPPSDAPFPIGETGRAVPSPPAPTKPQFRASTILEGMLIRKVQPAYPALARSVRVQGPVILDAVISKAGTIEQLQLISGHPLLVPAAIEAVKQWRYRPYILNGEAIEVETRVTVNFILQGS